MPAPMAVTLTVRRTTRPWPFAGGGVGDGHLGPGQSFQLGQERRQVAFDRQQVVRATAGEVADMAPLGVQRVGGDDRPGDVHAVQQRAERVDLIGLPSTTACPSTTPVAVSNAASRCVARSLPRRAPRAAFRIRNDQEADLVKAPSAMDRNDGGCPTAAVMFGVPGIRVLAAGEVGGEPHVLVEIVERVGGCRSCGVVAAAHQRQEHLLRRAVRASASGGDVAQADLAVRRGGLPGEPTLQDRGHPHVREPSWSARSRDDQWVTPSRCGGGSDVVDRPRPTRFRSIVQTGQPLGAYRFYQPITVGLEALTHPVVVAGPSRPRSVGQGQSGRVRPGGWRPTVRTR